MDGDIGRQDAEKALDIRHAGKDQRVELGVLAVFGDVEVGAPAKGIGDRADKEVIRTGGKRLYRGFGHVGQFPVIKGVSVAAIEDKALVGDGEADPFGQAAGVHKGAQGHKDTGCQYDAHHYAGLVFHLEDVHGEIGQVSDQQHAQDGADRPAHNQQRNVRLLQHLHRFRGRPPRGRSRLCAECF